MEQPLILQHLIENLNKGDKRSFEKLFFMFNKKIYFLARKFKLSHQDAEEIVQDVFMILWSKRESLNQEYSINAYIFKITQTKILKYFRKRNVEQAYLEILSNMPKVHDDSPSVESFDLQSIINQYIDELPYQQKKVFILSRQENYSHEDIARRLNISVRTVESHIYKSLKYLKNKLASEDILAISFLYFCII